MSVVRASFRPAFGTNRILAEACASSVPEAHLTYGDLAGCSSAMQKLFALLSRLESSLASVVIEGESGTGKELIARAIHRYSSVSQGAFIALNCGSIEPSLVRSEL